MLNHSRSDSEELELSFSFEQFDRDSDPGMVFGIKSPEAMSNRRLARILFLVLLYIIVSSSLTLYNKWIISTYAFHYPITLIFSHLAISGTIAVALCLTKFKRRLMYNDYWPSNIDAKTFFYKLLPPGVLIGLDIVFSNASLEFTSVSLMEVIKGGIPMLVLIFGILTKEETYSTLKLIVITFLWLGIIFTSEGEKNFDFTGFILASMSTLCGAIRLVLMQTLLSKNGKTAIIHPKLHPLLSLAYFAPISAISLFIPMITIEIPKIAQSQFSAHPLEVTALILVGVVLAFSLNMIELYLLEASSALTLCVSGIVKLVIIILLSSLFFNYSFTTFNAIGISLCILGIIGYNYVRFKDQAVDSPTNMFKRVHDETEDAFNPSNT